MSPSAAHGQFRQKTQQMRLLCETLQTDCTHQHSAARACNGVTASGCTGRCDDAAGLTEGLRAPPGLADQETQLPGCSPHQPKKNPLSSVCQKQ